MAKNFACKTLYEFDDLLLKVINETLRYVLGDINAGIIFDYLEKKSCPFSEIPRNLHIFSTALRDLLGCGRGQILGSASILENAIAEIFCRKLGMEFDKGEFTVLVGYIEKLRAAYGDKEVVMLEK
jgi:hypothetical protein